MKPTIRTLTLCANRSCCRLRPVRNWEKDVGTAEARGTDDSVRNIFGRMSRGEEVKENHRRRLMMIWIRKKGKHSVTAGGIGAWEINNFFGKKSEAS